MQITEYIFKSFSKVVHRFQLFFFLKSSITENLLCAETEKSKSPFFYSLYSGLAPPLHHGPSVQLCGVVVLFGRGRLAKNLTGLATE